MIHLFNKVYIKPDTHFARSKDCILISPMAALVADDKIAHITETDFGKIHYAATSFQELLQHFSNDESVFMDWLVNFDETKRLTVYCDQETLVHLVLKWFKTILINADEATAYKVVRLTFLRYAYLWGFPFVPFVRLSEHQAAKYKTVGASMNEPEDFSVAWAATTPFVVDFDNAAARTSLEFQLASYLVNPAWDNAQTVNDKLVMMTKKYQVRDLIDAKHILLHRLYTQPGFDMLSQTLLEYVVATPEYSILLDPDVLPDKYEHVEQHYNPNEMRNTVVSRAQYLEGLTDTDALVNSKFLDPAITGDDIIAIEEGSPLIRVHLACWEYQEVVNVYLLDHILNLHKAGNTAELKKFSLLKV